MPTSKVPGRSIVKICKASAFRSEVIPDVTIHISTALPENCDLHGSQTLFNREAGEIAQALRSLPQGTRHALLGLLLAEHSILFYGPTPPPSDPGVNPCPAHRSTRGDEYRCVAGPDGHVGEHRFEDGR